MKKKYLIIYLLFTTVKGYAQFNISGTVIEDETGQPLSGANVALKKSFITVATDKDGKFIIDKLKTGIYELHISYIGYEMKTERVSLDGNKEINISLKRSSILTEEITVTATRVDNKSAAAFTNLDKSEIEKNNLGQDIPYILNYTPSVVTTSDAGMGIGYTGIRIRGSDASRINVTINGIPLNDAESQNVYWVDLPDFASSVDNIQLQRGAGTSTNGAGAFGGSINLLTDKLSAEPFVQSSVAFGSFNSMKTNLSLGTGLIDDHWAFEGRLSKITSDGYIDRGTSDLKSYFVSGGYYDKNTTLRLNVFSGKEITYQCWNGVPESVVKNDKNKMLAYTDRNYLDSSDAYNLLNSGRSYNYFTYDNQVDDYMQNHYQLLFSHQLDHNWNLNMALHYTKGAGYYEEYKKADDAYGEGLFSFYNLPDVIIGSDTITSTDFIRRKWLDNDFYGGTFSLNYDNNKNLKLIIGGAGNQYDGDHFGEIIWSQYMSNAPIRYRYYYDKALKNDFNIFGKTMYDFSKKFSAFADLQYRNVRYTFAGYDDLLSPSDQTVNLNFFNPKIGMHVQHNPYLDGYVSVSMANHEPSRDDYVESSPSSRPKPESMLDIESGFHLQKNNLRLSVNYYMMIYKDQLVLTGELNDVGNYTRTNIGRSYREGIETELGFSILKNLGVNINVTYSRNKIKEFTEYVDDYNSGEQIINTYKNSDIAFSPSLTGMAGITYEPFKNFSLSLLNKYVGKQYLDNTANNSKKIDSYSVSDLRISYTLHLKSFKELGFNLLVANLFNRKYSSNGYTYSYKSGGSMVTENFFYPQGGINMLGQVTVRF